MTLPHVALGWLLSVVIVLQQAALPGTGTLISLFFLVVIAAWRIPAIRSLLTGAIVGLAVLSIALNHVHARQLTQAQVSSDLRLQVRVSSLPVKTAYGIRFAAEVIRCESCVSTFGPKRVMLNWYSHSPELSAGDHWALTVRLKPITSLRNPGGFDRAQWSLVNGMHARGYVRPSPEARRLVSTSAVDMTSIRAALARTMRENPSATETVGVVEALTLGIKSGIDETTWNLLRDTGTSHLLAISGLHVSLLAGWAYWAARVLLRPVSTFPSRPGRPRRQIDSRMLALFCGFLVALCYALLAGFALPVQRAIIMLLVWAVASWRFRALSPLAGLSLAMLSVLAGNVFSPLSAGLWLSFGTVAAIFYLHRGHQIGVQATEKRGTPGLIAHGLDAWHRYCWAALRTHLMLGFALIPVSAWFFQSGSLVAPIANLVAVPFVGFIVVPLCFVALLTSAIGSGLTDSVLHIAQRAIDVLILFLQHMAALDMSSLTLSLPHSGVMALCLAGVIVGLSPNGGGFRWFAIPLLLPAIMFNTQSSVEDGFEVHVLDVGQGLSALVLTDNHTLLFDTGGKASSSRSMVEAVVLPYLYSLGRRSIDTLVVSHGDEDHAFGVADVLRRFPDVRLVVGSGLPHEQRELAEPCAAGLTWQHDDVQFSIVHPGKLDSGSDNDRSCVLLVHFGASRALLTGDIERGAEQALSRRLGRFPIDLMTAPHHGSNTSSTHELLSMLSPAHVVFSAGAGNRYGFPHAAVQLRYKLSGTRQYTTGTVGAVSFDFGRSGLLGNPATWWQTRRRFWHGFINPACSELFAGQAHVVRKLELAQKGQALCGK